MASQAQIEANRRNALKSTGPRTPRGKAVASRNVLKHGLFAHDVNLDPRAEREILRLARGYCRDFRPDGPRQTLRVLRLAIAAWNSSHVLAMGLETYAKCTLANGFRPLDTLRRYQARVEASPYRALHDLEGLPVRQAIEQSELSFFPDALSAAG